MASSDSIGVSMQNKMAIAEVKKSKAPKKGFFGGLGDTISTALYKAKNMNSNQLKK